jgi:hypothetical protein
MKTKPFMSGEEYDPDKMIYLRNHEQSARFAKYIKMRDVILSAGKFTYVFDREEAEPLMIKWRNYELE